MAWEYWTFNDVRLPYLNGESDLGTPTATGALVPVVGGLWDTIGTGTAYLTTVHQIMLRGVYIGDIAGYGYRYLARGTTTGGTTARGTGVALQGRVVSDPARQAELEFDALVAQWGKRGALIIRNPHTEQTRTKTARLLRVERMQRVEHGIGVIEVGVLFETSDIVWT